MPDESFPQTGACAFCNREATRQYVLHEGRDFYVIADHAPVAEAHLLLIPTAHYPHLAALSPELSEEFHALKSQIGDFVRAHYGQVTCWENGVFGQSVPHAHLHSISVQMDTDLISRHSTPFTTLEDLRTHHAANPGHYFLVEHEGVGRIMPPDRRLYWDIISDARVRNGGTWRFGPEERRQHGRAQVEALIRRWREHHGDTADRLLKSL